jgi:formylglycine-generating enzyme required for sulfatase activity
LGGVCVTRAQAVVIETVTVGNPGNPGEQSRLSSSDPTFYGGVDYTFSMGKFEVTAGQYTELLNAVAATDTHDLYDSRMDYDADPSRNGCNIKREGASGSFTYSVAPDWANRPVNYVSWADAARFANWLHNGQPTGAQDLTTTEDGSYFINGIHESADQLLEDVVREPDATWVIPTDNEWYKAAFHKNDGVTGNYWNYGTSSDLRPANDLIDPDPGNHATFHVGVFGDPAGFTIGPPYNRTEVGAHENSSSAYGTFDQAGNMMEFTETVPESDIRRMRDGSWKGDSGLMASSEFDDVMHSSDRFDFLGFRLANVAVGGPVCGDGTCDAGENPINCPADCPAVCGDGLCSSGEDAQNCPADCAECIENADCDDGQFCNGAESCTGGECQAGTPVDCDDGVGCTIDTCNEAADACDNTPDDSACDNGLFCDGAETCDPVLDCLTGADPCGGTACDEGTNTCEPSVCDNDGACESGEDCTNCPNDCISGTSSGAVCGNAICEAGDGEDCVSCPSDCNGVQNGRPSGRFCCGDGDGQNPLSCSDSACSTGGWSCTDTPTGGGTSYCCGDGACEGDEDFTNCGIDCPAPFCDDGNCDPGEDQCNCSADCGTPPAAESNCSDGQDNDCDGLIDGSDPDCPDCGGPGAACSSNGDCCSGRCKGNGTCK